MKRLFSAIPAFSIVTLCCALALAGPAVADAAAQEEPAVAEPVPEAPSDEAVP